MELKKGEKVFRPSFELSDKPLIELFVFISDKSDGIVEVINDKGIVHYFNDKEIFTDLTEAKKYYLNWLAHTYNNIKENWFPPMPEIKEEPKQ